MDDLFVCDLMFLLCFIHILINALTFVDVVICGELLLQFI